MKSNKPLLPALVAQLHHRLPRLLRQWRHPRWHFGPRRRSPRHLEIQLEFPGLLKR